MEVVEQVNVDQGVYARLRSLIVERIDAEAALHMKPEELEESRLQEPSPTRCRRSGSF